MPCFTIHLALLNRTRKIGLNSEHCTFEQDFPNRQVSNLIVVHYG